MNNENEALNQNDVNIQTDSPTAEQTAGETTTEVHTEVGETGESRKGAQARIRELNAAKNAVEEENRSLKDKIAEITQPNGFMDTISTFNPQSNQIEDDDTIDAETFRRRVLSEADARTELRIKNLEAVNRINRETEEAVRMFPELDPKSETFNKELSESISEATEAYVNNNPYSASVIKFVEKLMKPYKKAIEVEVGQASENIAKQVSQAALRPTTIRKQEKTASEKSIGELEQELGIVQS